MRFIDAILEGVSVSAASTMIAAVKLPSLKGSILSGVQVRLRRSGTSENCSMFLATATDPATPSWVSTNAYFRERGRVLPTEGQSLPAGLAVYSGHGANAPTSPVTFWPFDFQTLAGEREEPKVEGMWEFEVSKLICLYNRDTLTTAMLADICLSFQIIG